MNSTEYDPSPLVRLLQEGAPAAALAGPGEAFCRHYGLDFDPPPARRWLQSLTVKGLAMDGGHIALHHFVPPDPTGSLILVHGYLDHHGLYGHLIQYALARRLAVLCFDLPGHGLSSGPPASIDDFDRYQRVFAAVLAHQATLGWPGPRHLLGQSTGAAIINTYLLEQRPAPDGAVVLLAPLVRPARWPLVRGAHGLLSPWLDSVPRAFPANSHDPAFLRFLQHKDPLQASAMAVAWVSALLRWIPRFCGLPPASGYRPLIIQGREDDTVDWRYNLPVLREKFPDARVCYLDRGRHHLANESAFIRQQYLDWLDQHWPG